MLLFTGFFGADAASCSVNVAAGLRPVAGIPSSPLVRFAGLARGSCRSRAGVTSVVCGLWTLAACACCTCAPASPRPVALQPPWRATAPGRHRSRQAPPPPPPGGRGVTHGIMHAGTLVTGHAQPLCRAYRLGPVCGPHLPPPIPQHPRIWSRPGALPLPPPRPPRPPPPPPPHDTTAACCSLSRLVAPRPGQGPAFPDSPPPPPRAAQAPQVRMPRMRLPAAAAARFPLPLPPVVGGAWGSWASACSSTCTRQQQGGWLSQAAGGPRAATQRTCKWSLMPHCLHCCPQSLASAGAASSGAAGLGRPAS